MALIIITVELSIDLLHTIVGNPKKQYITKKTGTCFLTVGESPTNKKADNKSYPLVGHLGLEPRTSRL